MPLRLRRTFAVIPVALALVFGLLPAGALAVAAAPKVVVIVGPTGPQTDDYRRSADRVADAATAAGADVVKVYSPNATWANVKAAVEGANVIVYLGHGNGYPNPYNTSENPNSVNGWGLNRTTTNGDGDDWTSTLVYCGENALLGTMPSSLKGWWGGQWEYCGGSTGTQGIHPAPGFVMIYQSACYTPGAGETAGATEAVAAERVQNYSFPVFALGGSAYFANDLGARSIVDLVLRNPDMTYGDIARGASGYSETDQVHFSHPDVPNTEIWIQQTDDLTRLDYWYAYAGNPNLTPSSTGTSALFTDIGSSAFKSDILWLADQGITGGCAPYRYCPNGYVTRAQMAAFLGRALGLTAGTGANLFDDDNGLWAEADIDRLATAGVTSGCADRRYCPNGYVTREQMASFLVRALKLKAGAGANLFDDDDNSPHQGDIDRLATAGVTAGCAYRTYCPGGYVTRGQMAAFLHRAFGD